MSKQSRSGTSAVTVPESATALAVSATCASSSTMIAMAARSAGVRGELGQGGAVGGRVGDHDVVRHAGAHEPDRLRQREREHAVEPGAGQGPGDQLADADRLAGDPDRHAAGPVQQVGRVGVERVQVDHGERWVEGRRRGVEPRSEVGHPPSCPVRHHRVVTTSRVGPSTGGTTWTNWARTEVAHPAAVVRPRSVDDVSRVVRAAVDAGRRVKAVGSGHSFTGVAVTDGVQVRLDQLTRRLDVHGDGLVTVGAGWPLHALGPALAAHGLAMSNLGDIDVQTISGAIGTGHARHGWRFGGISDQVRGLQLVLADGSVVECSAGRRPRPVPVGAGRAGRLRRGDRDDVAVRARLRAARGRGPDAAGRGAGRVDELIAANDHFEFYWFPHTDRALTKRNNRVRRRHAAGAARPGARLRRRRAAVQHALRGAEPARHPGAARRPVAERGQRPRPQRPRVHRRLVPGLRLVARRPLPGERVGDAAGGDAAGAARDRRLGGAHGERLPFPVEVRFGAADEPWLSTANGRDTAWIAVHQYHRMDHRRYFGAVSRSWPPTRDGRTGARCTPWGPRISRPLPAVRRRHGGAGPGRPGAGLRQRLPGAGLRRLSLGLMGRFGR